MHALERISLDAYLPVYGPAAIDVGGATCLRAPHSPDSPMLNRVVGLGVDGPVDEAQLDDALTAMGDTSFYVAVSPSADASLDGLLEARGLEPGWGWMLFERGPSPAPSVETALRIVEVDARHSRRVGRRRRNRLRSSRRRAPVVRGDPRDHRLARVSRARRRRARRCRRRLDRRARCLLRNGRDRSRAPWQGRSGRALRRPDRASARSGLHDARHRDGRVASREPELVVPQHPPLRIRGAVRRRPPAAPTPAG